MEKNYKRKALETRRRTTRESDLSSAIFINVSRDPFLVMTHVSLRNPYKLFFLHILFIYEFHIKLKAGRTNTFTKNTILPNDDDEMGTWQKKIYATTTKLLTSKNMFWCFYIIDVHEPICKQRKIVVTDCYREKWLRVGQSKYCYILFAFFAGKVLKLWYKVNIYLIYYVSRIPTCFIVLNSILNLKA